MMPSSVSPSSTQNKFQKNSNHQQSPVQKKVSKGIKSDMFSSGIDNIEKAVPDVVDGSIEWSVSVDITRKSEDDSSDDDDDDVFGASFL